MGDVKATGPRIRRETERKVLKGIFGAPRPRSVSFDFRHGARTPVWHEVAVRAHLIVAAVGTVALLGLAGTAIWLALPSQRPVAMAKTGPAAIKSAAVALPQLPDEDETPAAQNADELRQNAAPAATAQPAMTALVEPEPLPQADPRWTGPSSKSAKPVKTHSIVVDSAAQDEDGTVEPIAVNAFAAQDKSSTAAISGTKPAAGAARPSESDIAAADEGQTRPGQALQAVTMRAKPSSRGAVLGTIPGRADVQVVSCDSWCEIVYDGKRGFVYKRFLKNDGR